MNEKIEPLISSRLSLLFIGMVIGSFLPTIVFTLINIDNIYSRSIAFIGLTIGGVIGYFKGRKIDKI